MYFHREAKVGYLAHPRTASRTTRDVLKDIGFEAGIGHHEGIQRTKDHFGLSLDKDEWLILATVRNHWDAIVSWREVSTFEVEFGIEYVEKLINNRHMYFPDRHRFYGLHLDNADCVLRYESLEEDLNQALAKRDLGPVALPEFGSYASTLRPEDPEERDYKTWYDPSTQAFVKGLFYDEIEELGYEF